jgi:hypothetical protein
MWLQCGEFARLPHRGASCRIAHGVGGGNRFGETNARQSRYAGRLVGTMQVVFRPDRDIADVAAAYALDAVDLSASRFKMQLDFSEESVASVERVLGDLHESLAISRPQADRLWTFAKAFGSYLGEVFRNAHGGEWGMVSARGQTVPGLRWAARDLTFCPWLRAHGRILHGSEENVWQYYEALRAGTVPLGLP